MRTLDEIKDALCKLSRKDRAKFHLWYTAFDNAVWDKEMEADVASGKFDRLLGGLERDIRENRLTELDV